MKEVFKILIIEDNNKNMELLNECFNRINGYKFEIEFADRFFICIEKMRNNKFDVVLLDLVLPDIQYSELLYTINKILQDAPIIILANNSDKELASQYVQEELAQDYLLLNEINARNLLKSLMYSLELIELIKKVNTYEVKVSAMENQLSNLVDSILNGIIIVDKKLNILLQNNFAKKIFKNAHDFKNFFNSIIKVKLPLPNEFYWCFENRYFEIYIEKIWWNKKEGLIIYLKDITKRNKMEMDFLEKTTELEQAMAKKINHFELVNKKLLDEILKRRKVEKKLKQLILRDPKTELYSRDYFFSFINNTVIDKKKKYAIIICYINFFKLINYTFGYKIGNIVLKEVANLIKLSFQTNYNIISRVGEDEFAILMEETKEDELEKKYKSLKQIFNKCFVTDYKIPISLNINYVKFTEIHETLYDLFCEVEYSITKSHFFKDCNNNVNQFVFFLTKKIKEKTNRHQKEEELLKTLLTEMLTKLDKYERTEVDKIINFKDIGLLKISDSIIKKNGLLTEQEKEKLHKHPIYGSQIINFLAEINSIKDIILKHNEWWNGSGYPLGLKGDEIPLKSRALAIVEAYCAMTNRRPYRKPFTSLDAISEINKLSGVQFDPKLVKLFTNIHLNLKL